MGRRHISAALALVVLGAVAVGCGPLDVARQYGTIDNPLQSLTSPYYGRSWAGLAVSQSNVRNTLYVHGCTTETGVVHVTLRVPTLDGYTPDAVYGVTITDPGGATTEQHQVGDTMTSPHTIQPGDCFTVALNSTVTYGPDTECEGGVNCGPDVYTWPGADYTIYW
jgi:hypothetical protein